MGRKKKGEITGKEYEELLKRALEPFKPIRTKEDVLKHEAEIREESINAMHKMKEDISESELATIKSRADFEHGWSD